MTSYAAAGRDSNLALGTECMLGYVVTSSGNTGLWTVVLKETLQGVGTLLSDTLPHAGAISPLAKTAYAKLRFTLQGLPVAGNTYVEGYQQDAAAHTQTVAAGMTEFGFVGSSVVAPPIAAINLTQPFTLEIAAQSNAGGAATVALTNFYTRYYRVGP